MRLPRCLILPAFGVAVIASSCFWVWVSLNKPSFPVSVSVSVSPPNQPDPTAQKPKLNENVPQWRAFEQRAQLFLESQLAPQGFHARLAGGSDATAADINLYDASQKRVLSVEAKFSPSQCGQIVVLDNGHAFELSQDAVFQNPVDPQIVAFLNAHYAEFSAPAASLVKLQGINDLLAQRVVQHYQQKDSHFFITSQEGQSFFRLVPTLKLAESFEISAVCRHKKSGTADVPKKDLAQAQAALEAHLQKLQVRYESLAVEGKLLLLKGTPEGALSKEQLYFGDGTYFLSSETAGAFRVKKRSKTNNLNIVFSLKYHGPQENGGVEALVAFLRDPNAGNAGIR